MQRSWVRLLTLSAVLSSSFQCTLSQTAASQTADKPAPAASQEISARLGRNLTSKKMKVGDQVEFNVEGPITPPAGVNATIPGKAKLIAQVTTVVRYSKQDRIARLGFALTQIDWKGGSLPVSGHAVSFDEKQAHDLQYKKCTSEASSDTGMSRYGVPSAKYQACHQLPPLNLEPNAGTFMVTDQDVQLDSGQKISFSVDFAKK